MSDSLLPPDPANFQQGANAPAALDNPASVTGGIVPAAAQAASDVTPPTPPAPAPTPADKPSVWKSVVQGALQGLAGSKGATSFGGGLAGGASGVLQAQQQSRDNATQDKAQELANQQQTDAHMKAAVDVAHTQALIAQVQRATLNMPENHQQAVIDGRADQTEQMRRLGAMIPVGSEDSSPDHHVALQQVTALTKQNPGKLYSAEPVRNSDGKISFQAMQVTDAPLSEDVPLLDLNGNKVGVIPRGTPGTAAAKLQVNALQQGITDMGAKQKADTLKAQAAMVKAGAAAKTAASKANPAALTTDALGFQPKLPVTGAEGYQKTANAFKKNLDDLSQTEQSYQQFAETVRKIDAGQTFTGADSIVGLFNAIGISAEPLKGKGFRINNLTVAEHAGARGIRQAIEQKFGKLETGEIITPQQLKDYASIASQVRENKYVGLVNQMHNAGLNADQALPTGNGQKIDKSTARIFVRLTGGDPNKAMDVAKAKGWTF